MRFNAGTGIGLMSFGVGGPLSHFTCPPPAPGRWIPRSTRDRDGDDTLPLHTAPADRRPRNLRDAARVICSFAWARCRSVPAFRILGWLDKADNGVLVGVTAVLTADSVASALSGVAKGVQWVSSISMVLAAVLTIFVFVVGPTVLILNLVPTAVGDYFRDLAGHGREDEASGTDAMGTWLSGWTVFSRGSAAAGRSASSSQRIAGCRAWSFCCGSAFCHCGDRPAAWRHRNRPRLDHQGQLFGILEHIPLTAITTSIVVPAAIASGADAVSIVIGTLSVCDAIEPRSRW